MNQGTLINLQALATTREHARRAKEKAAALLKSLKTSASKGSAPIASTSAPTATAPAPNPETAPVTATTSARTPARPAEAPAFGKTKWLERSGEIQFNLPDEDRRFPVRLEYCPVHYRRPELARVADRKGRLKYGVVCPACDPNMLQVAWQDSSAAAVRVYQLAAKLAKL